MATFFKAKSRGSSHLNSVLCYRPYINAADAQCELVDIQFRVLLRRPACLYSRCDVLAIHHVVIHMAAILFPRCVSRHTSLCSHTDLEYKSQKSTCFHVDLKTNAIIASATNRSNYVVSCFLGMVIQMLTYALQYAHGGCLLWSARIERWTCGGGLLAAY